MSSKNGVAATVTPLAVRVAQELGLELWDVEFVREGASWYLRFYIDKDGGVTIDDCEAFHRRIDPLIDDADPIEQSYYLEVSSPGVERELKKPRHFEYGLNRAVRVRLFRPDADGRKEITGTLAGFTEAEITIETAGERVVLRRPDIAVIRLVDEEPDGGME